MMRCSSPTARLMTFAEVAFAEHASIIGFNSTSSSGFEFSRLDLSKARSSNRSAVSATSLAALTSGFLRFVSEDSAVSSEMSSCDILGCGPAVVIEIKAKAE